MQSFVHGIIGIDPFFSYEQVQSIVEPLFGDKKVEDKTGSMKRKIRDPQDAGAENIAGNLAKRNILSQKGKGQTHIFAIKKLPPLIIN